MFMTTLKLHLQKGEGHNYFTKIKTIQFNLIHHMYELHVVQSEGARPTCR